MWGLLTIGFVFGLSKDEEIYREVKMDPHRSEAKAAIAVIKKFYGTVISIEHRKVFRRGDKDKRIQTKQAVGCELVPVGPCETEAEV